MRSKIEQLDNYNALDTNKSPIDLLTEMKNIVCGRESHQQPIFSMAELVKTLFCDIQGFKEDNEAYKEQWEGLWDAIEQKGGSPW